MLIRTIVATGLEKLLPPIGCEFKTRLAIIFHQIILRELLPKRRDLYSKQVELVLLSECDPSNNQNRTVHLLASLILRICSRRCRSENNVYSADQPAFSVW